MPHTYMRTRPGVIGTNSCFSRVSELWIFSTIFHRAFSRGGLRKQVTRYRRYGVGRPRPVAHQRPPRAHQPIQASRYRARRLAPHHAARDRGQVASLDRGQGAPGQTPAFRGKASYGFSAWPGTDLRHPGRPPRGGPTPVWQARTMPGVLQEFPVLIARCSW